MRDDLFAALRRRLSDETGMGMIVVILMIVVAAALGTTVAVAGISGLKNATRDRAAAAAQATSDAGVAEAVGYIRSHSIGLMTCSEPLNPSSSSWQTAAGCTTPGWTDPTSPEIVSGGSTHVGGSCQAGQNCWEVWIGTLQTYSPGTENSSGTGPNPATPAVLRIHSVGFSGVGPGARSVDVDVTAAPANFPIGVYGNSVTEHSAASYVQAESIFTEGNITVKCGLEGWDPQYNMPAAIHSAGTISYQGHCPNPSPEPGVGQGSDPTVSCGLNSSGVPSDPYDQDSNGGSYANTACYNYDQSDPNPSLPPVGSRPTPYYSSTSRFTASDLAQYGYVPGGLTQAQYGQLQTLSSQEGTYNVTGSALTTALENLVSQGVTDPVIYDDNGTTAPSWNDLKDVSVSPCPTDSSLGSCNPFFRTASSSATFGGTSTCTPYALTIVVRSNSLSWSGNPPASGQSLVASIFVPDSPNSFSTAGNVTIIGTVFAYSVSFEGDTSPAFQLDTCFVQNPPSGVLDIHLINYHAVDNGNLQ